jgi:hypothetical protein
VVAVVAVVVVVVVMSLSISPSSTSRRAIMATWIRACDNSVTTVYQ